jgi:uncharacterized protein (DUF2249 family)
MRSLGGGDRDGTVMSAPARRPAELDGRRPVELDVREEIRRGEEPLARILAAVGTLGTADVLVLRAPFEPVPLYAVLGRRGYTHWTEQRAAGDWYVWFWRGPATAAEETEPVRAPVPAAAGSAPAPESSDVTLDVRGLAPPLPMVRVLEQLETLPPGGTLTVLHERRPMFLYPQLDARGFHHQTDEPAPGLVRLTIHRPRA